MGGAAVWMDIPLGGAEFCVPHDLLNDRRGDIPQGQGGGRSVPAGIRWEIPDAGPLEGGVIFSIKIITVHSNHIPGPAFTVFNQRGQHRGDHFRENETVLPPISRSRYSRA